MVPEVVAVVVAAKRKREQSISHRICIGRIFACRGPNGSGNSRDGCAVYCVVWNGNYWGCHVVRGSTKATERTIIITKVTNQECVVLFLLCELMVGRLEG